MSDIYAENHQLDPDDRPLDILRNHGDAVKMVHQLEDDLRRLWHFAGCPYDHCQKCIDDAEWIKSLHERLGSPSAGSVQAQHDQGPA